MAKNVSLGDYFDRFVEEKVRSGRYATASEVIRAGLRKLEEDELSDAELRNALLAEIRKGLADPEFVEGDLAFSEIDDLIAQAENR